MRGEEDGEESIGGVELGRDGVVWHVGGEEAGDRVEDVGEGPGPAGVDSMAVLHCGLHLGAVHTAGSPRGGPKAGHPWGWSAGGGCSWLGRSLCRGTKVQIYLEILLFY